MKQYILTAIISFLLSVGYSFATGIGHIPQIKEKSEVEKYMQALAKIKSNQIDYAYISTSMFKQIFNMIESDVEFKNIVNPLTSIKSMRRFMTTGDNGYKLLSEALQPFMQTEESVMGMKLMALNREKGNLNVIYSNSNSILLINDHVDNELTIVFIMGLTYDTFMMMSDNGMDFNFDF